MDSTKTQEFIPGVTEDINITPKAVDEIKRLIKENNIPESYGLRIGVKGGGCSGMTYTLGFDAEPKPTDNVFDFGGVNVFVDMKCFLYLSGTELDYVDGLNGKGFTFNNPNAKRTCGCGSSFSA
ncbi:MAG TPA: iron-sulfur cluster assembly accessory protein [Ignavibacteria bacterium]|nr:iron-sulfur cluster assembly accessory protein [Ignavibacteria bacterium]